MKPGRQSQADSLAAANVLDFGQPSVAITPPAPLAGRALELFEQTVSAAGPDHFAQSDAPLLATYASAVALLEEARRHVDEDGAVEGSRPSAWYTIMEKQSKLVSTLSMRLRLAPHSRYDSRAAGRKSQRRRRTYEDMNDGS